MDKEKESERRNKTVSYNFLLDTSSRAARFVLLTKSWLATNSYLSFNTDLATIGLNATANVKRDGVTKKVRVYGVLFVIKKK